MCFENAAEKNKAFIAYLKSFREVLRAIKMLTLENVLAIEAH